MPGYNWEEALVQAAAAILLAIQAWALACRLSLDAAHKVGDAALAAALMAFNLWLDWSGARLAARTAQV